MNNVTIIGAGLAGCEAALQLGNRGYNVTLYDAKSLLDVQLYNLDTFAELVCNNSLGSLDTNVPSGLLLKELDILGCETLKIAKKCRVQDPCCLAVDKNSFSCSVTDKLMKYDNIHIINKQVESIPNDDYVIIATGPVTNSMLLNDLSKKYSVEEYYFWDASSPVIDIRTVDFSSKYIKKITEDMYTISIPYDVFHDFYFALMNQSNNIRSHYIDSTIEFDKCFTLEQLAKDGMNTLCSKRFTHRDAIFPTLVLRREKALANGFILVGCTTALRHSSQRTVFRLLPGLTNCVFIKYGRIHLNTYLLAPKILNEFFQIKGTNTFVVGQLSGIDGYSAAIASGLIASMRIIYGNNMPRVPTSTIIGGLARYVSSDDVAEFTPMGASFSLMTKNDISTEQVLTEFLNSIKRKE